MQGRGLRSVLPAHEQADDAADGVLLDSYQKFFWCPALFVGHG